MTTIRRTTTGAINRKLTSLGFEKLNNDNVGFEVHGSEDGTVFVVHHVYRLSTMEQELQAAGYVTERFEVRDWTKFLGKYCETFHVVGRVDA